MQSKSLRGSLLDLQVRGFSGGSPKSSFGSSPGEILPNALLKVFLKILIETLLNFLKNSYKKLLTEPLADPLADPLTESVERKLVLKRVLAIKRAQIELQYAKLYQIVS